MKKENLNDVVEEVTEEVVDEGLKLDPKNLGTVAGALVITGFAIKGIIETVKGWKAKRAAKAESGSEGEKKSFKNLFHKKTTEENPIEEVNE